jgi:hypothetical protein
MSIEPILTEIQQQHAAWSALSLDQQRAAYASYTVALDEGWAGFHPSAVALARIYEGGDPPT